MRKNSPKNLYSDNLRHVGKVTSVQKTVLGSALTVATTAAVTSTITVQDTSDFNEYGGTLEIVGDVGTSTETYTAVDDDAGTITLSGTTTLSHSVDDSVSPTPLINIYYAEVLVDDDESMSITARIPFSMVPFFATGVRDDTEQESVIIELRDLEWVVNDIIGEEPQLIPDPEREWVSVIKVNSETTTADAALSTDSELFFEVMESTVYIWRANIFYSTTAAADFKCDWTYPAGSTVTISHRAVAPGTASTTQIGVSTTDGLQNITGPNGGDGWVEVEARIVVSTTPGTVSFRWAQNTSSGGNTSVYRGSHIDYRVVN